MISKNEIYHMANLKLKECGLLLTTDDDLEVMDEDLAVKSVESAKLDIKLDDVIDVLLNK